MKKHLALIMAIITLFVFSGCASDQQTDMKVEDEEKENEIVKTENGMVVIEPGVNIKGSWVVLSTPETIQFPNYDMHDSQAMTDVTIRASINAIFPLGGIIDIYENGVASCNGLSMDYKFVSEDAVEFRAQGTGLIFKVSKEDDVLTLKLNEKYDVKLEYNK